MSKFKTLIAGIAIGSAATLLVAAGGYVALKKAKPLITKVISKVSDLRFARIKKAGRDLMIADFESPEDFKKFSDSNAEYALSKDFVTSGAYGAKVMFKKSKASFLKVERYFEKDKSFSNWAPYGSFLFDIYNPSEHKERLILQIKDSRGERYKQDVYVEPKTQETVEVEVALLRHHLSVYRIAQINLFRWEAQSDTTLFIDNLRLVPERIITKKTIFDPEFTESKEPVYAAGDYFSFPKQRWTDKNGQAAFPVHIVNASPVPLKDFPGRGGIPFPKGELTSANSLAIFDNEGRPIPLQTRTMALWNDNSIKWLLVDASISAPARSWAEYKAVYPCKAELRQDKAMIGETPDAVSIDTGKIKLQISKKQFRLFDKVWVAGKEIVSQGSDLVVWFRKNAYRASLDKEYRLTVEETGPLVAGVKAEGWFIGPNKKKFCRFIVRIKAYRNESFVRVYHTFVYTGYPENKFHYLYKGLRLPKNETINEVALHVRIPEVAQDSVITFAADGNVLQANTGVENLKLLQAKDDSFAVVKNQKEKISEGKRLEGWIDVSQPQKGMSISVRKLWQQYPKAFEVDRKKNLLVIKLWPSEAGNLDLKTTEKTPGPEDVARGSAFGLAKTHECVFYFHEGDYKKGGAREAALAAEEPALLMASPEWFSATKVLGAVSDSTEGSAYFHEYEQSLEWLFDWANRQKIDFRWYGMLDFGDTLSWYREDAYDKSYDEWGWHPEGRWGWFNCEGAGTHTGALLQFLRTSDHKYFEFGEDLSRHLMDVDTCHFNTVASDKRLRRMYQDYSQPGSMHRHSGDHWGGRNEEASHTNLNGILLYYYLTGYERALDVAQEIGEFFLKNPITYFKHPDVAPHRAMANILWGETALYEATRDERLKKAADAWANLFFQGQNRNGSFSENYNPRDKKWEGDPHTGYMDGYTLPALIEYHRLTGNAAIKNTIIKLTDYLIKNDAYGAIFPGPAYCYFLTGDKKYLEELEKRLEAMNGSQRRQDDPLWHGMIYQKLYYARAAEFLLFTPYAFEALLSTQNQQNETGNQ